MTMQADGPTIRPMTEADLDRVVATARGLHGAPQWPLAAYRKALSPDSAPPRIALVAETGGEVAGFAVAGLLPPDSELETIAVAAGLQRRGIARALFIELAARLRALGAQVMLLEVRESNRPAINFYRALGFAEVGRRSRYYADPVEDAVLMRVELKARPGA